MFCKLTAMQFVVFFILANTITFCLGRHLSFAEEYKLSERVTRNDNDEMKEVYKTHFLPAPFSYSKPFKIKPKYDEATDRRSQEEKYYLNLEENKKSLRNDLQEFKRGGRNNGRLNMNEFLALKLYTGPDYEILNYFLRNGKMPDKENLTELGQKVLPKWKKATVKEVVEDITSGLKKLQEEEHKTLYRGTTLDANVFSNGKKVTIKSLTQGNIFKMEGFISTTTQWNEAAKIAQELSENFRSKPAILVLSKNAKNQGFLAANIESLSKNKNEEERLILPGVEFQVVSTKEQNVLVERKNKPSVVATISVIEVTKF